MVNYHGMLGYGKFCFSPVPPEPIGSSLASCAETSPAILSQTSCGHLLYSYIHVDLQASRRFVSASFLISKFWEWGFIHHISIGDGFSPKKNMTWHDNPCHDYHLYTLGSSPGCRLGTGWRFVKNTAFRVQGSKPSRCSTQRLSSRA